MSVLFQALHKAARDYRVQKFPVVVPLLPLTPQAARMRLAKKGVAIAALALVVTSGALWLLSKPAATQTPVAVAPVAFVPPSAPVSPPVQQEMAGAAPLPAPQPVPDKAINEEPQGIALPVDSLAVPSFDEPVTREVTQQVRETPVLASPNKKKKPAPQIVVSTPGAQPRELVEARRYSEAIALYDKILEKDGNDQEAWNGKIYALQQSGSGESVAELHKMIEFRPFSASVHAAKAQILMRDGDNETALAAWRRAVELEPANKTYRLSLAILCDRMGKDAEALSLYRQIPSPLPYAVQQRLEYLAQRAAPVSVP